MSTNFRHKPANFRRSLKRNLKKFWSFCFSKNVLLILIVAVLVLIFCIPKLVPFLISKFSFSSICAKKLSEDTQHSSFWPMLITVFITLIGSLVSTYAFLNPALDRKADEKPYYRSVVQRFKEDIIESLITIISLVFIFAVSIVILYIPLFFQSERSPECFRIFLIGLHILITAKVFHILYICVSMDEALCETARDMLEEQLWELYTHSPIEDFLILHISDIVSVLSEEEKSNIKSFADWLQISAADNGNDDLRFDLDMEGFIFLFSRWETLITLLAQQEDKVSDLQPASDRLNTALQQTLITNNRKKILEIEAKDAYTNSWKNFSFFTTETEGNLINTFKFVSPISNEDSLDNKLIDLFFRFSGIRDLLKVIMDKRESIRNFADIYKIFAAPCGEKGIAPETFSTLLCSLIVHFSIRFLPDLPRINVFFPSGRFLLANFYDTRFENSSFKSSAFYNSVFSRSNVENSNFSMSKFSYCHFFGTSFLNCSLGNSVMNRCNFSGASFAHSDFTGVAATSCCLIGSSFRDSIVENAHIENSNLSDMKFSDCEIRNTLITFCADLLKKEKKLVFSKCAFVSTHLENLALELPYIADRVCSTDPDKPEKAGALSNIVNHFFRVYYSLFYKTSHSDELREKIKNFGSRSLLFLSLDCSAENKIPENPVWETIKGKIWIEMRECAFHNSTVSNLKICTADAGKNVFLNSQLKSALFFFVDMNGCSLIESNFQESTFFAVILKNSTLENSVFYDSYCKLINFDDAVLRHLNISHSVLQLCSFGRSICDKMDLSYSESTKCLFLNASLSFSNLSGSTFLSSDFTMCKAENLLSPCSQFSNCKFSDSVFRSSTFDNSEFEGCSFVFSDFSECSFVESVFKNCTFEESVFKDSVFHKAHFINCTGLDNESRKILRNMGAEID